MNKGYVLPDPKDEKQWVSCLVLSYKTFKGVEFDDKHWDRVNFARCAKSARALIDICGSLRAADSCLTEKGTAWDTDGISWTLETVVRHAHEWAQKKKGAAHGKPARKRFFDAIAQSKTAGRTSESGSFTAAREVLNGVRSLPHVSDPAGKSE